MTDGNQVLREHFLEWVAVGLVAFFIFAGVAFYSFSVDVRSVNAPAQSTDGKANHRTLVGRRHEAPVECPRLSAPCHPKWARVPTYSA